jgi:hypothetical protein
MGEPQVQQTPPGFWGRLWNKVKKVAAAVISKAAAAITAIRNWICSWKFLIGFIVMGIGVLLVLFKWPVTGIIVFVIGVAILFCGILY